VLIPAQSEERTRWPRPKGQKPSAHVDAARLAVLAEMMEEEATDAVLLGHLPGPGSHVADVRPWMPSWAGPEPEAPAGRPGAAGIG
jgi:hypothetical protein